MIPYEEYRKRAIASAKKACEDAGVFKGFPSPEKYVSQIEPYIKKKYKEESELMERGDVIHRPGECVGTFIYMIYPEYPDDCEPENREKNL